VHCATSADQLPAGGLDKAAMKFSKAPRTWSSGSPGVSWVIFSATEVAKSCNAVWIEILLVMMLSFPFYFTDPDN